MTAAARSRFAVITVRDARLIATMPAKKQSQSTIDSTYYVQRTGCDENECYVENAVSSESLSQFESAMERNRSAAASVWKSALRMVRTMSSPKRPQSVFGSQCSKELMEPAIVYKKAGAQISKNCPCVSGATCICQDRLAP